MEAEARKQRREAKPAAFELCDVCNLNHDQGRRHRYAASHRRNLSAVLSRFQSKLSDLRFFLRHPAPLRPEHSALNRLWCVFCALDLQELGSRFVCSNIITHLASPEHLKSVKDYLWKHGGGMDRIDTFRVCETDFVKWEQSCNSLQNATTLSTKESIGPKPGPAKDIQNQITPNHADSFRNNSTSSFDSCVSQNVMPLQHPTHKDHQIWYSEISNAAFASPTPYIASSSSVDVLSNARLPSIHHFGTAVENLKGRQPKCPGTNKEGFVNLYQNNGMDQRTTSGKACVQAPDNVHTGGCPPWLETSNESKLDLANAEPDKSSLAVTVALRAKSRKLNPKRVGAAWAEKRRVELELEKRGEIIANTCDANWLPSFGRVWQTGTRKESRKEFEKEKPKFFKDENQSETSFKLQPYISKRRRVDSSENDDAADSHVEGFSNASLERT